MGIPSSLPTNPNPSPSPPLPQSPPPQTPPLPQSPPLPPSQTPTLIPPTPLSPQTEPQNETPVFETQFPEPILKPAPTQTKSKGKTKKAVGRPKKAPVEKRKRAPSIPFDLNSPPQPSSEPVSKRTRSSSQIPPPAVQTPVSQSPLNSSAAPASSANDIEEGSGYKNIEWQQTIYDPVQFWKDIAPFGGYYRQRTAKASRIVDHEGDTVTALWVLEIYFSCGA
ncbi:vegetative cell wall protein gp1-like [Hevea brasiliensis]|uniref:vegetative cell wall protein gp1-like n=1 Tax=Hevea brasiliensis TaxID=3981 RepID=UPI0025D2A8F8|nr:vegetative cell wall protein gp1-like [Hevea brasiliensis]